MVLNGQGKGLWTRSGTLCDYSSTYGNVLDKNEGVCVYNKSYSAKEKLNCKMCSRMNGNRQPLEVTGGETLQNVPEPQEVRESPDSRKGFYMICPTMERGNSQSPPPVK